MQLDEMTIFYIAVFVFFVCPIAIVVCGIVADQMTKRNQPPPDDDQWSCPVVRRVTNPVRSNGPMVQTNDQ